MASSRPESSQIFTLNPKTDGDKEGSDPLQDPAQGQPPNVTGKQGGQSTDEHDTTGSKRSRDDENDGDSADDDWYVVIKSPAWTMAE